MLGWQIFTHSVRLVWANRGVALRLSAVLYIISAIVQVWTKELQVGDVAAATPGTGSVFLDLILAVVSLIISLWIAVAWHRYILLEEIPDGYLPQWHGDRMAAYFGRSILIMLVMLGVILVSSVPLIIGMSGAIGGPFLALGIIFAIFVFYRLCAILPSSAMGKPITMREAWVATEGTTGTIIVLIICMIVCLFLMFMPAALFGAISTALGMAYLIIAQWFVTMFGISIFTTFYGYFIEKRELS